MKIRRISPDERPSTAFPLAAYAFERSPATAAAVAEYETYRPYNEGHVTLIAEDGGTTLAAVSAIPMRQNVRGTVFPMAGIAGVATHPLARRRGHIRALLDRLLAQMRDAGHPVTALYPFRPSFYARFGYVGLPMPRTVSFSPADLGDLLKADLCGEVTWRRIREGYDDYREFTLRALRERHGFAVLPDYRAVRLRDADEHWLVTARVDGETVGAATYRIEEHGGHLIAGDLLSSGPHGRALLLRFFAGHVDQVSRVSARVPADELPELWATDLATRIEAEASFPRSAGPMARVLSLPALSGIAAGPGRVAVEVVEDPFVGGRYVLDGTDGRLAVRTGGGTGPQATLTAAGLAALVYGVLDPAEVVVRGLGAVPHDAAAELRRIFPRRSPYLFADF